MAHPQPRDVRSGPSTIRRIVCLDIAYNCTRTRLNTTTPPPPNPSESDLPDPVQTHTIAFVMNVARLIDATDFTLAPGHVLRRASATEVAHIKQGLIYFQTFTPPLSPWETNRASDGTVEFLREDEWRYFVIHCEGITESLREIERAARLAPVELEIAFKIGELSNGESGGYTLHPGRLFYRMQEAGWGRFGFVKIGAAEIEQIKNLLAPLEAHDRSEIDVDRLTDELLELDALPPRSPLLLLGYFGMLESLLTHQSDPKDPLDSITRQIKNKVALLDNRFDHRLDYSSFAEASAEKIWTRMYELRSRLAHGDAPNFEGKLSILRDHQNALQVIRQTVKAVLRQALREPKLVADLKNC